MADLAFNKGALTSSEAGKVSSGNPYGFLRESLGITWDSFRGIPQGSLRDSLRIPLGFRMESLRSHPKELGMDPNGFLRNSVGNP